VRAEIWVSDSSRAPRSSVRIHGGFTCTRARTARASWGPSRQALRLITPPAPNLPSEPPIILEAFTVNTQRDRGYIAVDALAGGRTNLPIKLTPGSLSSLTRTFLDDLGIQDIREALRWSVNVVPSDPLAGKGFAGQAFHAWSYNFRGAGAGQQGGPGPTPNYFSFFENPDSYNIDRVEFTRGPNSILFGLGTVGGTLSTYTKIPRFDKTFFSPAVIADDHGSLRFEADGRCRLLPQLAGILRELLPEHPPAECRLPALSERRPALAGGRRGV